MTRGSVVLVFVAVVLLLVAPPVAQAVQCDSVTLTDADGVTWGFDEDADANATNRDGVDNWGNAYFERDSSPSWTTASGCMLEGAGREIFFPEETFVGLQVSAKVFVPATAPAFVRHLWFFRNTGGTPVDVEVYRGGCASCDYTTTDLLTSSSGDEAVTTDDDWLTFENEADATDPAVASIWQGALGPLPTVVAGVFAECCTPPPGPVIEDGFGGVEVVYENMTVQPGETKILMHLLLVRPDGAAAADAALLLAGATAAASAGMTEDEVAAVQNWDLDGDVDEDGVLDDADNCLEVANAGQADLDGDGQGDACDADDDGDGLSDEVEAAIGTDTRGTDTDGDGVPDGGDPCPTVAGPAGGCPSGATGGTGTPAPLPPGAAPPVVVLGRLDPASSSAALRRRGRRFTARGTLVLPDGLTPQQGCAAGLVELRARRGRRAAGRRRARLRPDCTFAVTVRARRRGRIRFTVRWLGNRFLEPVTIGTFTRRVR